jgi:hypothetical protein
MKKTPYSNQKDYAFWDKGVVNLNKEDVDPFIFAKFKINKAQKIATAGSCFAQHIARHLKKNGFNFYIAEKAHSLIDEELSLEYGFNDFSARYGNVYTIRQLLQLFLRAFGKFKPHDNAWKSMDGSWIDPFRPRIQPGGFQSPLELNLDRTQHLKAVKKMFLNMDVFIFTMGLTECWLSRKDGSVFPLCPGVAGGHFSSKKYYLSNLSFNENKHDLVLFIESLKKINPRAKIILTLSPVPLIATATDNHVLSATSYSKAVLRSICEEIQAKYKHVIYFPSYEIITGAFNRGAYFARDLRSVTEEGVEHVMKVFLKHFNQNKTDNFKGKIISTNESFSKKMENWVKVNCDEIALEQTKTNRKI